MPTLQRILQAAANCLTSGGGGRPPKRSPHCWRGWVKGVGYVNTGVGSPLACEPADPGSYTGDGTREDYLRQLAYSAKQEAENVTYAPHYAMDPGNTEARRGVVAADWNVFPSCLDTILERAGYAVEWSDQVSTCDECYGIVVEDPYGQQDYRVVNECEIICNRCYVAPEPDEDEGDDDDDEEVGA